MSLQYGLGAVQSHHHECRGESIGHGTCGSHDRAAQYAVLHGITAVWIYGVSHTLAIVHVEVAVITAGGNGAVMQFNDVLQQGTAVVRVVIGLVDAYAPCFSLGIPAA